VLEDVQAPRVRELVAAATAFRAAVEEAAAPSGSEWPARRLRNAVARVYMAAALLPRVPPATEDYALPAVDRTASVAIEDGLRRRFGCFDTFVDVWDPTEGAADDPIQRTLAGELVEIYDDLREALAWLEAAPAASDILWDVGYAFEIHWGKHAVDVLRPLHHLALRYSAPE
jgi:hypothetical protein